jgi:hypothetical protein
MRRILILLLILAAYAALLMALWIFRGRTISSFIDRYWTIETTSTPVSSIAYDGNGAGGILVFNGISLSLNDVKPGIAVSVGSTKDNQLALASNGRVFAFGPLKSTAEETGDHLATVTPAGDQAVVATRHSILSWPTSFDFNLVTGQSPSWKRHMYYEVQWKKSSGANLKMLWRYDQSFYPGNGWARGFMTHEGSTGLIRVEISE